MSVQLPSPVEQYRIELVERLLACAPGSVLDAGCGDGALLAALAPRVARVAGIDADAARVDAARARGIAAQVADASALPHADGEFDWVVLQYTAHHVAALDAAMRECWRVARVDGIEGDHTNVVGLSLPLLRRLLGELGLSVTDLWSAS